jgi:predicted DNA-binding transcriptional regulator AlpA
MSIQRILRTPEVRRAYGDPPKPTFYHRIKEGHIPRPDVMLGPQTPGWFASTIERDQKEKAERGVPIERHEEAVRRARMPRKKKAASLAPSLTATSCQRGTNTKERAAG